jgi:hypothetical protein
MSTSEEINTWANKVVFSWNAQSVKLEEGASSGIIEKAEQHLLFKFPDSFKILYNKANGFKDMDWNEHMFCFWPLHRVMEEYDYNRHPDFIGFCDFLISSLWIGFVRNQPGIFKRYNLQGLSNPEKIADSFEEAVEMINANAGMIY